MSCARHADAILEHALGEPASLELQAHLRECETCRAALEHERQLVGSIDNELRATLDVAPSPEFLPRVRQAAASETETRSAPWLRWLLPVAAMLAVVTWLRQPTPVPPQPAATLSVAPRREIPVPVPAATVTPAPPRTAAVRRPAPRLPQPEVLVPPGEEALLRRFVATLRAGRVDGTALVQPEAAPPPDLGIAPLAEAPSLELKPLTAESNPEGVIP
jgi:hypothetical protein